MTHDAAVLDAVPVVARLPRRHVAVCVAGLAGSVAGGWAAAVVPEATWLRWVDPTHLGSAPRLGTSLVFLGLAVASAIAFLWQTGGRRGRWLPGVLVGLGGAPVVLVVTLSVLGHAVVTALALGALGSVARAVLRLGERADQADLLARTVYASPSIGR